ncbi:MAG: acyl-CoA dehydrogenase family protein [Myxococcales bacterium]|nr:acyl-CoA dehydrogenase family protein [Myxococcales bacterium]
MTLTLSAEALSPFFEPRHQALAASLAARLDAPGVIDGDTPRAVAAQLGAMGLYAHLVPEDRGAVDVRALVLIREALGQRHTMADSIFAVQGLGAYPVLRAGNDAQRASLAKVVSGELIGAFALTEPDAGSDVASLKTTATRTPQGWVLEGEKWLISNVPMADRHVVFANADPSQGKRGISAFLVEAGAPGLHRAPLAMAGHALGRLVMTQCLVPHDALLGRVGEGMRLALETLDTFRVSVGAAACGMASRGLALSIERVKTRRQFGAPLAEQQMVRATLAEMATALDAARLLVVRAAWARDLGRPDASQAVARAKLFATETAQEILDKAVQLHGGAGVLDDAEVFKLWREVRPLRIYEGTSEIQKLIIAKGLLG